MSKGAMGIANFLFGLVATVLSLTFFIWYVEGLPYIGITGDSEANPVGFVLLMLVTGLGAAVVKKNLMFGLGVILGCLVGVVALVVWFQILPTDETSTTIFLLYWVPLIVSALGLGLVYRWRQRLKGKAG